MKGAAQQVAHVDEYISSDAIRVDDLVHLITHNQGNPDARFGSLSDQALGSAMLAWFVRST